MKIRTITCHNCYNYGASLQAFALQKYLQKLGHDVKIINYKSDARYDLWAVNNSRFDRPILKQIYLFLKLPNRFVNKINFKKKAFDRFNAKYLKQTEVYNNYEELKKYPPEADCYIAGSDQIWNTFLNNGKDKAFYLNFGNLDIKRISYAASFSSSSLNPLYEDFVKKELKNLDSISVRERSGIKILQSLGFDNAVVTCDPVFLLKKEEWEKLIPSLQNNRYILVYLTEKNKQVNNISKIIAKKLGCEIINIGYNESQFSNYGPLEFVRLIKDAQFILSNSFHAVSFSVLFEKHFAYIRRYEDMNERVLSLLNYIGLEDRIITEYHDFLINNIDYIQHKEELSKFIQGSKEWLIQTLQK